MAFKPDPSESRPLGTSVGQEAAHSNDQTDDKKPLLPGERVTAELGSIEEGLFQLTHARILLRQEERSDSGTLHASADLSDISSLVISRRPRARRSAALGITGLFCAIALWQITPNVLVGIVAAIAVAVVSLILMVDYWVRPTGIHLEIHAIRGTISGEIKVTVASALEFSNKVEYYRRQYASRRIIKPFRNYPSG